MDVLRNVFGNVTSGIIRLLVTVGILAATYFFILRPVLDTTNNAIDAASNGVHIFNSSQLRHLSQQSNTEGEKQQRLAHQLQARLAHIRRSGDLNDLSRVGKCAQAAGGDLTKMLVCVKRIQRQAARRPK